MGKWWETDEDEKDKRLPAEREEEEQVEIREFLGEIDEKAGRGAVLGSLGVMLGIRAIKASQLQQKRIEALEEGKGLGKLEEIQATVAIGDFEFDLQELLDLDEDFLDRVLDCVKETLADPSFGAALKRELGENVLPELAGIREEVEE